jgi:hypothetical protein
MSRPRAKAQLHISGDVNSSFASMLIQVAYSGRSVRRRNSLPPRKEYNSSAGTLFCMQFHIPNLAYKDKRSFDLAILDMNL